MRTLSKSVFSAALLCAAIGAGGSGAEAQSNKALLEELRRLSERMVELEAKVQSAEQRAAAAETKAQAAEQKSGGGATVSSGGAGARLTISGQVNRGLLYYDDGEDTDLRHVDNDNSSTRIRLIGEADVTSQFTVGSNIEVQFESNSTADVQQNDGGSVISSNSFTERKLEVYFDHDMLGRLSLGQGDTASNNTSEVDLSGTSVVAYSGLSDVGGSLLFRNDGGGLSGIELGDTVTNLDGLSRDDRLRYDTPSLGGFKLSGSIVDDNERDVAMTVDRTLGGVRFKAAAAYADRRNGVDQYNGSLSALHKATGLSVTGAAGTQSVAGDDPFFLYGKLGYQRQWFAFGPTALSLDAYYSENVNAADDDTTAYGAQAVQKISSAGTELYLGARVVDHEAPGENFDKIFTVLSGARLKF